MAIIEEAQSVLGRNLDNTSPFVEWVKEGRKYDLGAMLITQQPGAMAPELLSQADNWFCFHLLSEGDAGVLGKYNSHYSSDVLAHLIAEPIPGNCYMWSAPHQPFVLPVRLRDFGEIYGDQIRKETSEPSIEDTGAKEVIKAASDAIAHIKDKLVEQLKDSKTKYWRMPRRTSEKELLGIKGGQLYYLIRDSKSLEDIQTEDELKRPLLTLLLGEGALHVVEHDGGQYYCATSQNWELATGMKPTPSEL